MTDTAPRSAPALRPFRPRLALITGAAALGAATGAAAALVYLAMLVLQSAVWGAAGDARWTILPLTLAGGLLIGWTRLQARGTDLETQIIQSREPDRVHLRETFWVALGAIVAVGFGGAIGPEAGILAVTAQLGAVVARRLGRTAEDRRTLTAAGVSGALAGVYGSPAGGPVHTEAERRVPRPVLFLAGAAGLAAFVLLSETLWPGVLSLMHLPRLSAEGGLWDGLAALLPAAAGALAGVAYLQFRAGVEGLLEDRGAGVFWAPVAGGLALGLLCTLAPALLFSGHEQLAEVAESGLDRGWPALVLLGTGKALACAICIGSGWRGGVIFPMCFAGGALGAATLALLPDVDPALGVAAGMASAAAVGMARPIVAGLIMLFIVGGGLAVAVFTGALVGWAVLNALPARLIPSHDAHAADSGGGTP
jgi:H+/Cl- antiporter ClcA